MISRNKAKFIKSLQLKKFRKQEGAFVVEGAKSTLELINADFRILMLLGTEDFFKNHAPKLSGVDFEMIEASANELSTLGSFKTNNEALMVAVAKPNKLLSIIENEWFIALDDIRDPGNFGTIIRIADWYGIKQIVASPTSAELYNPKALHGSMGSFTRINVFYTELQPFFEQRPSIKVYGAVLDGKDFHQIKFSDGGALLIGNESNGINKALIPLIHQKIAIPKYGKAESLNAAIATAVICDRIKSSNG